MSHLLFYGQRRISLDVVAHSKHTAISPTRNHTNWRSKPAAKIRQPNDNNKRPKPTATTADTRFYSDSVGKPCLTLTVTGGGKFNAEEEAKALQAKIEEEIEGSSGSVTGGAPSPSSSPRKTCVRIATPPELYCPEEGRELFPNLFG